MPNAYSRQAKACRHRRLLPRGANNLVVSDLRLVDERQLLEDLAEDLVPDEYLIEPLLLFHAELVFVLTNKRLILKSGFYENPILLIPW